MLFVEDKKRRHDDVSRLLGWIRILPVEQAKVDDSVHFTQVQLQKGRNREADYVQYPTD